MMDDSKILGKSEPLQQDPGFPLNEVGGNDCYNSTSLLKLSSHLNQNIKAALWESLLSLRIYQLRLFVI